MGEFSELIKNFDKIRDYMRDFFIYGFKARGDFTQKSSRTYDNERRRIESYLGDYIKWDTTGGGKRVFVSLDSSKISQNPLYSAWKSKSFTANDIMLHFYILDLLKTKEGLTVEEITNELCEESGVCFDVQTVRIKVNEYVKEGILLSNKIGKAHSYSLSMDYLDNITDNYEGLIDAVKYYQEVAPIGVVGCYILDNEDRTNDIFAFKHHFIVHTLEDKILLMLVKAMEEKRKVKFINQSTRLGRTASISGVPLKIFVSSQSGRRYVNIFNEERHRFINHRLDYIKSVELLKVCEDYDYYKVKLEENLGRCWGVCFGGNTREENICLKLFIDEDKEGYIINRILREGKGGNLDRLDKNIYLYTNEVFDTNELMPWVKSFTGRIMSLECTNKVVENKFYRDMKRMEKMYLGGEEQ